MFWPILAWFLKIDSTYSPELKKKRPCVHLRGEVKIDVHLKISTNTFEVNGIFLVNTEILGWGGVSVYINLLIRKMTNKPL